VSNTTPTVLDVLREARRLLAEVGWTQGAMGRDANGTRLYLWDEGEPTPVCYCLAGAISVASGGPRTTAYRDARRALLGFLRYGLAVWNDAPSRTREDVLALLDRVIAEQEGGAQ
jgi:hypothetical protein